MLSVFPATTFGSPVATVCLRCQWNQWRLMLSRLLCSTLRRLQWSKTYAAPTPMTEYIAPAPSVLRSASSSHRARGGSFSGRIQCSCSCRGHNACSSHRAGVVSIPLNVYDASMMQVLDAVHQSVNQIPDVLVFDSMVEHNASSSSACAAPAPVDDWSMMSRRRLQLDRKAQEALADRAAAELLAEEAADKPAATMAKKGKHKR